MAHHQGGSLDQEHLAQTIIELTIRVAVLAALLYWSLVLVRPFITIVIWSAVLAVALYPTFEWLALRLGNRRRLAAFVITVASLLVVIGPATWLVLDLIESLQSLSARLDLSTMALPTPPMTVKAWPLIGEKVFDFVEFGGEQCQGGVREYCTAIKTARQRFAAHSCKCRYRCSAILYFDHCRRISFLPGAKNRRENQIICKEARAGPGQRTRRSCGGNGSRRVARRYRNLGLASVARRTGFYCGRNPWRELADVRGVDSWNCANRSGDYCISRHRLELDGTANDDGFAVHDLYGPGKSAG